MVDRSDTIPDLEKLSMVGETDMAQGNARQKETRAVMERLTRSHEAQQGLQVQTDAQR